MSHRLPTERSDAPASPVPAVGQAASRALGWSFLNTAVGRVGTLAVGIVLARLLGPESFGAFAVASVALAAMLSLNELGVSLAIVRWPGDPRTIAPTVNTIAVTFSVLLATVGFFAAPAFATAMGDPAATSVVRVMLIGVVLDGLASTPAALLQREFKGGRRAAIDQVNVWLGAILSIVCALAGFGAMSLAIGRLSGSITSAVMFLASSPLPYRFGFDRTQVPDLLKFGIPLAGSSLFVFAIGYADQIVVGSMLGTTALGYYVLAFNLASWPVNMFSQPLRNVVPATFARLQHDRRAMNGALKSIIGVLTAVGVPICLLLAGAAMPIVTFVYGPTWAPAAPALTLLAILAAFRIFFALAYDYLVVLGRSRAILIIQIVWLVVLIPSLILGASVAGVAGLAGVQVIVAAVVITPLYVAQFARAGLRPREVAARVWLPLTVGLFTGVLSLMVARVVPSPFLACVIAGTIGLLAVGLLVWRDRSELSSLRAMGT
jgi:O-antigen/teichoic acid export membrane protein